jgi:hypothetical protein
LPLAAAKDFLRRFAPNNVLKDASFSDFASRNRENEASLKRNFRRRRRQKTFYGASRKIMF